MQFQEATLFLDHQNRFEPLGEFARELAVERERHPELRDRECPARPARLRRSPDRAAPASGRNTICRRWRCRAMLLCRAAPPVQPFSRANSIAACSRRDVDFVFQRQCDRRDQPRVDRFLIALRNPNRRPIRIDHHRSAAVADVGDHLQARPTRPKIATARSPAARNR